VKNVLREVFSGTVLVGTVNLIAGIVMATTQSHSASQSWSMVFGFLAVFLPVPAVWDNMLNDYSLHTNRKRQKE
jgi:hypothetical protein